MDVQSSQLHVSHSDFFDAIPQARSIYDKYKCIYTDEHTKWLGRWVNRAERHAMDPSKQEITVKLINKLITEILVSPYDRSCFVANTEKRPVLYKGMIFPHWMLEDIFTLLGCPDGIQLAERHEFMHEILVWIKDLLERPVPSESRELIAREVAGALIIVNQTPLPTHLDCKLLVSINFLQNPELSIIKLSAYRDLMNKACREWELRKESKAAKGQLKQIVKFGQEQRDAVNQVKAQIAEQYVLHEEGVQKQFEDISRIQQSTENIMEEHYQNLIDEMNRAEERMKKLQQECKDREAAILALQAAQRNLHQ